MRRSASREPVPGLGDRLRRLRRLLGLTQAALGELIGVHGSMIAHWERGRGSPRLHDAILLCNVVGVSLDTLARGPVP